MEELIVKKVCFRSDGVKYVIIPKDSNLKKGELVVITRLNHKEVKHGRK